MLKKLFDFKLMAITIMLMIGSLMTVACSAEVTKDNFHWKKFDNSEELATFLGELFPLNTPRKEIENTLFDGGYVINTSENFDMRFFEKKPWRNAGYHKKCISKLLCR